jgi:hypothetical protein
VTVTQPDGTVLRTEGQGGGKVQWKDLTLTASVVTANDKGVLPLLRDPRISDGKVGHVTVTVPSHPDLKAELDVPFRYDVAFVSNFSGTSGTNGSDGGNGQDGGRGGDAPAVDVMITLHPGTSGSGDPLLEASVTALGKRRLYLIEPHGGSLTVKADGGAGGSGGKGGRGGQGAWAVRACRAAATGRTAPTGATA